jgi:hypothetical protein
MYLDDGVSRDSAPRDSLWAEAFMHMNDQTGEDQDNEPLHDSETNDMYREVIITQKWVTCTSPNHPITSPNTLQETRRDKDKTGKKSAFGTYQCQVWKGSISMA